MMDGARGASDWYCTCWSQYSFHIIWMMNVENVEKRPKLQWECEGVLLSKFQQRVKIGSVLLKLKAHEVIIESFLHTDSQSETSASRFMGYMAEPECCPSASNARESLICMQNTSLTCPKSQCAGGPGKSSKCRCDALLLTSRMANLYATKTNNTEAINWQAKDQPIDRNSITVCSSAILGWHLRLSRW